MVVMSTPAATCHFCQARLGRFALNTAHWTGTHFMRVDVCDAPTCRGQVARRPAAPRRARRQAVQVGDVAGWSAAAQLGRKLAR